MYKVPQQFYFRIHHVRPRFKGDIENVLIYMATAAAGISMQPENDFSDQMNSAIRQYPGNEIRKLKTINNWRTEISSLFGFYIVENGFTRPGLRAVELAESGDLVKAFKVFLYSFQYPGAHIKAHEVLKQIKAGIHFKPVQYILQVLDTAEEETGKRIGLTKEEVCHCIFNDLRCTAGLETSADTWHRIEHNRSTGEEYDSTGDVIRYAGDIIDYMEIANLIVSYDGKVYYKNALENEAVIKFIKSAEWFDGYDDMISKKSGTLAEIQALSADWYRFVNRDISDTDFSTNILAFISSNPEEYRELQKTSAEIYRNLLDQDDINTKDIGDMGETLVHSHECQYVKLGGRSDLIHLIKRIPTQFAAGYDIQSVELDERKRYIEVKTTISSKPLNFNKIHMTTNEWNTATSLNDRYYIYRLMISKQDRKLFVIQNPVGLYKQNVIKMVPKDGADIIFEPATAGTFEELLSWIN